MHINLIIYQQIRQFFPYEPTEEQEMAIKTLSVFVAERTNKDAMIIRGYAGTGKTTVISALVKGLSAINRKCVLLAPTGRAAKVFSQYSNHNAQTIHRHIYRQKSMSESYDSFSLRDNLFKDTIFIIDEASMISNQYVSGNIFGSGYLLDDLLQYVYNSKGCKAIFVGDTAQLPPVGEDETPALEDRTIESYGLSVSSLELSIVLRQAYDSGILWNATQIRLSMGDGYHVNIPKLKMKGFADIKIVNSSELIEEIENSYSKVGKDETIIICRSNKRANTFNKGVRDRVLWCDSELENGDRVMVVKNNYMWTENVKEIEFIANGETAIIKKVRKKRELYDFRFADVVISIPELQDIELEVTLLLNTLESNSPALSSEEQKRLFLNVLEDYQELTKKKERMEAMKKDRHYNALQIKYAYAITCHKAQGGQWKNVFLDQAHMPEEYLTPDFPKWLYTAFTRATDNLYLINYPEELSF